MGTYNQPYVPTSDTLWTDNLKIIQGTGSDVEQYYDGANWIFNPKAVGSGMLQVLYTGVGATPADALGIVNTTAAAVNAQQYSGAFLQSGKGWETTGGTSQTASWRQYVVPVQGATLTSYLAFDSSINDGAFTNRMALTSGGALLLGATTAYGRSGQTLEANTSGDFGGAALNTWSADTKGATFDLNKSRSSTIGTKTVVQTNDYLGYLTFRGADGDTPSAWANSSFIAGKAIGTIGAGRVPGQLEFHAYTDAASSVDTTVVSMTAATITWNTAVPHSNLAVASAGMIQGLGTGANGFILKNLKNAAASALSGTQLDVEIDIGGTPYYFTCYPTKA